MNHHERVSILEAWLKRYHDADRAWEQLREATHASPECAIFCAMFGVFDAYTDEIARRVGDNDAWLDWFLWENAAGNRGFEAKASGWAEARKISTAMDLALLIEGCLEEGQSSSNP